MTETPASRLRAAREAAGFEKAADFARAVDVPEPTYNAHENGGRGFREPTAKRYADKLGVSWQWLLVGDDSHPPPPPPTVAEHTEEFSLLPPQDQETVRALTRTLLSARGIR
ncbi:helix-turn-helix domain-containing protein [Azospirillum doebereinerae]|nr:helix-turn-helix transcriptional regulator [Azospirillum doebereinerae]MCG5241374.1 helix-turn-helix domain-containing protein [Azospirillum doebereinerae]